MRKNSKQTVVQELTLVLLDIRSVQNTASLFRIADCAGIQKIYLVGTTPTPIDRFKRVRTDFVKISLGAEKFVSWEYVPDVQALFKKLRGEKCEIVGLEQSFRAIDYKEYVMKGKTVLILGNEVTGVPEEVLNECDAVVEIPMLGTKESLNVSVAGAIILFRILNI